MVSLPKEPGLARRLAYGEYVRKKTYNNYTIRNLRIIGTQIPLTIVNLHPVNDIITYEELIELEDVKVGLSIKDLNANSHVYAKNTKLVLNISLCTICQEFFKYSNEIIREMNCGHPYHLHCIDRWFEENTYCPICKHVFN